MQEIVDQLDASLGAGLHYMTLMTALAIPDMAAALESKDGQASGKKYIAWVERWVHPQFLRTIVAAIPPQHRTPELIDALAAKLHPLTGADCYKFRCTMLHQGSTVHPTSNYERIIFLEPGGTFTTHYDQLNGALTIDLVSFCKEMIEAYRQWLPTIQADPHYRANIANSVKRHPGGLAPYIGGVDVIG